MPKTEVARPSPRERILAAADELFYREGVQSVGIERIINHAGVAKASLYHAFGSKEELILAYLQRRHEDLAARMERALTRFRTPRGRLLGVFDALGELFTDPEFNGCAFAMASAEAPPGGALQNAGDEYRTWVRTLFSTLATEAGAPDPDALARELHLLYDGAGQSARMDHDPSAATTAKDAAAVLIDDALKVKPARSRPSRS